LIGVDATSGSDEIVLGTRNGWAVRFEEVGVRAMGRGAHGVKGIELRGDDLVVDLVVTNENASVLTVCENGYGKRTQVGEYRKTRRGGKGVINIKTTERNGRVVAIKSVTDADELMLISAKGIALRTDLSQLREIGRATQGVRLIRLEEGDNVVAVAKIAREDDDESGEAKPANGETAETPGTDGEAGATPCDEMSPQPEASPPENADNTAAEPEDSSNGEANDA